MGNARGWRWTTLWKYVILMKKIIFIIISLLFIQIASADSSFKNLENRKTSYLDFILLKIENKLIQRHALLKAQAVVFRVQYQNVGTQVDYIKEKSKINISIVGIMDKERYTQKKYVPKITDCNILRNILLYGKYGYSFILQKRNTVLSDENMKEIFVSRFLNNLSLSDKEKNYIVNNTFAEVQIIDPVRGNDLTCEGNIAKELR